MSSESQPQIILATESSQLLDSFTKAKIKFHHNSTHFTPSSEDERLDPTQYVKDMSLEKANLYNTNKQNLIVSTFSRICLNQKLLLKPKNLKIGHQQLLAISGNTLDILTGITILDNKKSRRINQVHKYQVTIANLSHQEIEWYRSTKEFLTSPPINIHGLGIRFVKDTAGTETPTRLIIEQLINLGYEDFLMPKPNKNEPKPTHTGSHLPFL